MPHAVTTLGFDADDTLWQNEHYYKLTEARFTDLLAEHGEAPVVSGRLLEAERRNLKLYGYGIKGFTLSMIETAIEVTDGKVAVDVIDRILAIGRDLLSHPIDPLPHARAALERLKPDHRLVLITKGDLFDQERKLAQSGLGDYFDAVEIVSEKTPAVYDRVFRRHGDGPERALMVGNSLKSDVLPALAAGAYGVHVPHPLTWALEHAEAPEDAPRFRRVDTLGDLPALVASLRPD
ncbi:HAD family hydrolase [Mongoliimonas terrestris]|uniref:HAD family hydrolase n=1 Tax=Mongoliimonas terrestris TaxID=1709001 RepID=UPI000949550C|nr:HAD family hydrolase [Mongoliimonas terrestris]